MVEASHLSIHAYLLLGTRNLLRNPHRSALTLASLIVGIAGLTFLSAMNDGWLREMKSNFILTLNGHLQIHAQGFEAFQDLKRSIREPAKIGAMLESDPEVMAWTPRVRASGLAVLAGKHTNVQIMGVDPAREPRVTRLRECVTQGSWLHHDAPTGLLMGVSLAQTIGAQIGSRVVLMTQGSGGEMSSEVFYLRGILCAGTPQIDRVLAIVNLPVAQQWLAMDEAITDIVIRADSHAVTDTLYQRLSASLSGEDFEIIRWQDLDPMVRQWLQFSRAYTLVIILVVMVLVIVEVLNTMLMALHERSREIGMMTALGTRRRQLFNMLLLESSILVTVGAFIGSAAGVAAVLLFARTGIDLSGFANAFEFFYMNPIIRPVLTAASALQIITTTLVTALIAGLYPAWRASRILPVTALR
ncbi:MAG: FtsX-like permease family protein [Pseudomonadota bacterium]